MLRLVSILLSVLLFWSGVPLAAPPSAAVDRGSLSLAWDAHEIGLFQEAPGYLEGIGARSPVAAEAAWLRAECLLDLGRHAAAAEVLQAEPAQGLPDRTAFLLDVFWEWVWDATSREDYHDALAAAEQGRLALPEESTLEALREATRFRRAMGDALTGGKPETVLTSGETVALLAVGQQPRGPGWVRAYPWDLDLDWVPQCTLEDWMPGLAVRLQQAGRALWVRVPAGLLGSRVEAEACGARLVLRSDATGWVLSEGKGEVFVDADEWTFRAAAEGLGVRGAALFALTMARDELRAGAALAGWAREHRGRLEVDRVGALLRVRSPETGRFVDLDLAVWGGAFKPKDAEWAELWADLKAELTRPARPFRCFCGRKAVLREVLVADPGPFAVFERGPGFAVMVAALCPRHRQYVTPSTMQEWGVRPRDVLERARADAVANPWDLVFERGEGQGSGYVVLEGEGVSSLARRPELLLGALEAVDGMEARGRSVRVIAPSASTLVVCAAPGSAADAAAAQALLAAGRRGKNLSRLTYRTTVRLPGKGIGSFRLTQVD
jgi:hypothetical protein